jgi:cellulose synthase (UDP-forming)
LVQAPRQQSAAGISVASTGAMHNRSAQRTYHILLGAVLFTMVLMVAYVTVRISTARVERYSPAEAVLAILLLSAECFLLLHALGYFWSSVKACRRDALMSPDVFAVPTREPVAVIVAAFNEAEDVVDRTLAAIRAMDYPAITLYLLDDSTKEDCRAAAERLAARYGARLRARTNRVGFKAGALNDVVPEISEKYIAILDADQRPTEAWLKDVIPILEQDATLAMVQVPQVYVNTDGLRVARAARYQQAVFFEYICEGKAHSNAIYCCGSNVVLRRDALFSVEVELDGRRQFFDDTTVTEDFATSVRLHARGWRTEYVNEPYVHGMGPETLPAYFTQHMRWAMGSLAVGLTVMKMLLRHPRALTPGQWWEYLLSGTYYFVGCANLVFIAAPIAFLLFGVRPLQSQSDVYLLFFIPYLLFTMNLFFLGMKLRRYPIRGVWLASALSFATSWTYAKAAVIALLGLKRSFAVTPKGAGGSIPFRRMPVEVLLFLSTVTAAAAGAYHLVTADVSVPYVVTTAWATYHAVLLSTVLFYFNRPVTIEPELLAFARATPAA